MEDLLALEQAAERHAHQILNPEYSIEDLTQAFVQYRHCCEACIFADIHQAERHESRLWQLHTEARKYLHKILANFRKQGNEKSAATRQVTKGFLRFIKDSQAFFRNYIFRLNTAIGGLVELEAIAHKVKQDEQSESSLTSISVDCHEVVLAACHRALVYLGDLSRYRAAEKLDKSPDFGPSIGYYDLACALCPNSGLGHHQLAVVALEQRNHLRAIHHLYRAIVVEDPHPNAASNLHIEFEKTNSAWNRGELIEKGLPNDPETPKRTLIGWFVRFHSVCYGGKAFRGYDELERELLSQLTAQLRQSSLGNAFFRMVMINVAAQFFASENFQRESTNENQDAFLYFFRFNLRFFTILLNLFAEGLLYDNLDEHNEEDEYWLAARLTPVSRFILPGLRVYSAWLLSNTHLIAGLQTDEFAKSAIDEMWQAYCRTMDLTVALFPVWDLDELPEVKYMLEEDVDTLGVRALQNPRTSKIWHNKTTGFLRPRLGDAGVVRQCQAGEMLARIQEITSDAAFLANDTTETPLTLHGVRFYYAGKAFELPSSLQAAEAALMETDAEMKVSEKVASKPLSYAAAAAAAGTGTNANTTHTSKAPVANSAQPAKPTGPHVSNTVRQVQLSRMVDDLVDDDEADNPKTPPQLHSSSPAVLSSTDIGYDTIQDSGHDLSMSGYIVNSKLTVTSTAPSTPGGLPKVSIIRPEGEGHPSLQGPWERSSLPRGGASSPFPSGLPRGTLTSPAQRSDRGHNRVNSSNSVRSRHSPSLSEQWNTVEVTRRPGTAGTAQSGHGGNDGYRKFSNSEAASPLLFGAGGSVWSSPRAQQYQTFNHRNGQPG